MVSCYGLLSISAMWPCATVFQSSMKIMESGENTLNLEFDKCGQGMEVLVHND